MRLRFVFPPLLTGQCICDLDCCTVLPASVTACEVAFIAHMVLTVNAESDMALAAAVMSCPSKLSIAVCKQVAQCFACDAGECC